MKKAMLQTMQKLKIFNYILVLLSLLTVSACNNRESYQPGERDWLALSPKKPGGRKPTKQDPVDKRLHRDIEFGALQFLLDREAENLRFLEWSLEWAKAGDAVLAPPADEACFRIRTDRGWDQDNRRQFSLEYLGCGKQFTKQMVEVDGILDFVMTRNDSGKLLTVNVVEDNQHPLVYKVRSDSRKPVELTSTESIVLEWRNQDNAWKLKQFDLRLEITLLNRKGETSEVRLLSQDGLAKFENNEWIMSSKPELIWKIKNGTTLFHLVAPPQALMTRKEKNLRCHERESQEFVIHYGKSKELNRKFRASVKQRELSIELMIEENKFSDKRTINFGVCDEKQKSSEIPMFNWEKFVY